MTVAPIPESGYVNLYGHNITDRKLAEGKMKISNEELSMLFALSRSLAETDDLDEILTPGELPCRRECSLHLLKNCPFGWETIMLFEAHTLFGLSTMTFGSVTVIRLSRFLTHSKFLKGTCL